MNNQKNKNEKFNNSGINLSQFPIGRKEEPISPKPFSLQGLKTFWAQMDKKNLVYSVIIVIALILIIVFLALPFGRMGGKKTTLTQSLPAFPSSAEEGGI